jgi:hypothetical protein
MIKRILKWLSHLILNNAIYWGVKFEDDLPPEFLITNHGIDRMNERLGKKKELTKKEARKIVLRAWHKGVDITRRMRSQRNYYKTVSQIETKADKVYRSFMGCTFVFGLRYPKHMGGLSQKVLITVIE